MISFRSLVIIRRKTSRKELESNIFFRVSNGQEKQTFKARPNDSSTSIITSNIFSSGKDVDGFKLSGNYAIKGKCTKEYGSLHSMQE